MYEFEYHLGSTEYDQQIPRIMETSSFMNAKKVFLYMSMCSQVPRSYWSQTEVDGMHSRSLMRQPEQLTVTGGGHSDFDVRHRVGTQCHYVPNGMEMPSDVNCGMG